MATIVTTVDKQFGNYQDVFIYTVNASFNGINEAIETARIELLFPNNLTVHLGDIESPFNGYEAVVEGENTRYTFTLDEITDLGVAVRLGLGVEFNVDSITGETFELNSELYVNGELIQTHIADVITLDATADFRYDRDVILPTIDPTPGSAVFFKVALVNFGDLGPTIENVKFEVPNVDGITIDTEYEISGYDASTTAKFIDTSQDGVVATVENNIITFELSSYHGERYEFTYRCIIADTFTTGVKVPTLMNYYLSDEFVETDSISLTLGTSVFELTSSIYGPTYSQAGSYMSYELNYSNTGNEILEDFTFFEELSSEIQYTGIYTGSFYVSETNQMLESEVYIDYVTINGVSDRLGPYQADVSEYIETSVFVDDGDNLSTLTWVIGTFGLGCKTLSPPTIDGIISTSVATGRTLLNHLENTWAQDGTSVMQEKNQEISIETTSVLSPTFTSTTTDVPQNPNSTLTYTLSASTRDARLIDPILVALLPAELEYLGNVTLAFDGYYGEEAPIVPEPTVIVDFTDLGETIVKFEFKDEYAYTFEQKTTFGISFDATISSDATGTLSTYMILNTLTASSALDPDASVYRDYDNIAEDTDVYFEYAKSSTVSNIILFFISVSSFKQVKGSLDTDFLSYPNVGTTIEGGDLTYTLNVKNTGNSALSYIKVLDILPHTSDTGVVLTEENRESEFAVYLKSDVIARVLPDNIEAPVVMSYSTSYDPLRFGPTFNQIGIDTGSWSYTQPTDYTTIKSIRVETDNFELQPNQTLEISFMATIPTGVELNSTAWNSFAADIYYNDLSEVEQRMLAIEPVKSGITIVEAPSDTASISGYAFFDTNSNGLFDDGEERIDDIGVEVFTLDGTSVGQGFTTPDADGNSGFYTISNLPLEECYVQFYIDTELYRFTTQNTEFENGSVCDASGKTSTLDLSENQSLENINIGFLLKSSAYDLDTILEVNKQARSMMRSTIYNQMLIGMKHEDVVDLARKEIE